MSGKQGRSGHTLPNSIPALKGQLEAGKVTQQAAVVLALVLWRSCTILSRTETPFNSWRVVRAKPWFVPRVRLLAHLCDEVERICNFVLAQPGCGSIRRDGSC